MPFGRLATLSPTLIGMAWMVASGLVFSVLNTVLRVVALQMNPAQVQFMRYFCGLLIMLPLVALFYNGLTLSGPHRATWGMRLVGIEMRMRDGTHVGFLVAAVHAVLFYVLNYCFTPIILLFGLFRADRRLAHDVLTGTILVRTVRFVL